MVYGAGTEIHCVSIYSTTRQLSLYLPPVYAAHLQGILSDQFSSVIEHPDDASVGYIVDYTIRR